MPLTLIATPGADDANAYADVATADAQLAYRVGASGWVGLSSDQKIQALVTATQAIDALEADPGFTIADRSSDDQALAWPRGGDTELPEALVKGTVELAFSYVPRFATGDTTDPLNPDPNEGNIKVDKVGPIETEFFAPREDAITGLGQFPAAVQRWLTGLVNVATSLWGSAEVSRGS